MRLYRLNDEGPAVRDIQDRLTALGHECEADVRGVFGEGTRRAVIGFQREKGLDADGIVGPDTWRSLYEAGYRLGDRLLYLRRPMLRGEDVAELQSRLNALGFESGKVDGIFGPNTDRAVIEFQHNRGLAEDGKAGPEVITEMRLVTRGEMRAGRQAIREQEWLRRLPPTVAGARVCFDAGCRNPEEARAAWEAASTAALHLQEQGGVPILSRAQDVDLPERVRAARANRLGADLIVVFQLATDDVDSVFYFSSPHGHSHVGRMLAEALAGTLGGNVEGRAGAMLKETRAPAIVVSRHTLDAQTGSAVVTGLNEFLAQAQSANVR